MVKLEKIKGLLEEQKKELEEKFQVEKMGIFGSYVRGEQNKTSDLDLLVSFKNPVGLFKFVALERYLTNITGQKVDLVMQSALKPRIGKHILKEVVYILLRSPRI